MPSILISLFVAFLNLNPIFANTMNSDLKGEFLVITSELTSSKKLSESLKDNGLNFSVDKIDGSKSTFFLKTKSNGELLKRLIETNLFSLVEKNQLVQKVNTETLIGTRKTTGRNFLTNDPEISKAWGLYQEGGPHINAADAWKIRTSSDDIIIAVLDSGVDLTHPDLKNNLWVNEKEIPGNGIDDDNNGYIDDIHGIDAHNQTNNPQDLVGHGTLIAGIIGAQGNNGIGGSGVLWKTRLMAIAGERGDGVMSYEGVIRGGYYAAKMGAKVINGSWGTYSPVGTIKQMLIDISEYGVVLVNAVGNNTNDIDHQRLEYPAAYMLPNVIAVTATKQSDDLVHYASFGKKYVHLAAPGWLVHTTKLGGGTTLRAGTSVAAPFVTAAVAMVMAEFPELNYKEVIERILKNVDRVAGLKEKVKTGGRLNLAKALAP